VVLLADSPKDASSVVDTGNTTGAGSAPALAPAADLPEGWFGPDYPVNSSGESYGSDSRANSPKEGPDLVAVTSDTGESGFVRSADLYPQTAEARAREMALKPGESLVLNVFDQEGTNIIGTFTMPRGTSRDIPEGEKE
jgi:hypothetical protein